MTEKDLVIYAAGDIGPDRADPGSIFRYVSAALKQSDIAFCQLEVNLSQRGTGPLGKENARDPGIAQALKNAGFKVVSFAGNHCIESGRDAFFDTISNIKKQGLSIIGVGADIKEARQPAIIECKGTKTAFLAYNSVAKDEFWAKINRPGCAPLRVSTSYESIDPHQPGMPAKVLTFANKDDLKAMQRDVKLAKEQADIVVVSMHAGIHMTPAVIADYQVELAHAAINTGADLVLQHHSHILKGIEIYLGKAIFYGLGNFALEVRFMTEEWTKGAHFKTVGKTLNPDWQPPYADYPSFPFPPDSRKTIIAKCIVNGGKINKVSYLPVMINRQAEPEILSPEDTRFKEIFNYMETITKDQGIDTRFVIYKNEVIVTG
jgi:poly-gamma-glutamate capsule biosynthesis protein CapA/YwtB (metallophosphatase superfamily)